MTEPIPPDPPEVPRYIEEDIPVGRVEATALFDSTVGLIPRLARIGDQILASAARPDVRGTTWTVTGPWGTGKSTALRYVRECILDAVGDQPPPIFVDFPAPLYAQGSARAGLMLETYLAAEQWLHDHLGDSLGEGPQSVTSTAIDALRVQPGSMAGHFDAEVARLKAQGELADALRRSIDAGLTFEQRLPEIIRAKTGLTPPTVILIDDLDRPTDSAYVRDVLVAANYWTQLANHFVVIAADEDRIRAALAEQLGPANGAADAGLSKYVQVTVRLPPAIVSPAAAAALLRNYVERNSLAAAMQELLVGELGKVDGDARTSADRGLLGPLVEPCVPRELKERFNELVSVLGGAQEPSTQVVQRAVLETRWREVFRTRVEPAELGRDRVQHSWCAHLVDLAELVRADAPRTDQRTQVAMLLDVARLSGLSIDEGEAAMGLYLAANPPSWLGRAQPALTPLGGPLGPRMSPELIARDFAPADAALPDIPGMVSQNLRDRLIDLRTAAEARDARRMKAAFDEIVPSIEALDDIPSELAPVLGNLALRFASLEMPQQALRLHICAMRADPDHINVSQNLVDYVLDKEIRPYYDGCAAILDHIESIPAGRNWKPHRTRLLRLRLAVATGRPPEHADVTELVEGAVAEGSVWGPAELVDLLNVADALKRYELVDGIGGALIRSEAGDLYEQTRSLRAIADTIANSDDPRDEDFGAEIYLFLLRSGLVERFTAQNQAETMTNLATLLRGRDQRRPAAYLEWEAYRRHQTPELALRLARALNELGDTETGRAMLEGRIAVPERPPAEPPFRQPLLPVNERAREFCRRHFPEESYGPPVLPALEEAP